MTYKKQTKTLSIDRKFFNSMSFVAILFMLLLFAGMSGFFLANLMAQEHTNAFHQLDYIKKQLSYYLTSTDNYSKTIISDRQVQAFIMANTKGAAVSGTEARQVKAQINHIIQSTPFIHSVSLYAQDGRLLAATDPYPLPAEAAYFCAENTPDWVEMYKHPHNNYELLIAVISLIRPVYDIASGRMLGFVEISIPETVISEIYAENMTNDSRLFMTDEAGFIRSSADPAALGSQYERGQLIQGCAQEASFFCGASLIFCRRFPTLGWYIVHEMKISSFLLPLASLFLISVLMAAFCILICILVSHRVSQSITFPINHLITHTKKIKDGNWEPVTPVRCDTELCTLFDSFNSMLMAQEQLKDDLMLSEKMKRQISLQLLQQQVNPHFLYNTLDNIYSLAELDEKATLMDLVMNLSSFYRLALGDGKFHVTIADELKLSEAYLNIMQVRYFDKFDFTIDCPEALYPCGCLKLLLQPIVENSIYHGIKEISYRGRIDIAVRESDEAVCFTISDNGAGFSEQAYAHIWREEGGHFGVKNIHQRIQLYYGPDFGLSMENRPEGGCRTIIRIARQEGTDHDTQRTHRG